MFNVGDRFLYVGLPNETPVIRWELVVKGSTTQGELVVEMLEPETHVSAGFLSVPITRVERLRNLSIWVVA